MKQKKSNLLKSRLIEAFKEEKLRDYAWLIPDGNVNGFMEKRIKRMTITFLLSLILYVSIYFILKYFDIIIPIQFGGVIAFICSYMVFKFPFWTLKTNFNKRKNDVYKSFPLWVSTLEILIMTNNITNTFKKSIATCPATFKNELIDFVAKIESEPENKEHYKNFLKKYKIEDVSEIIMDMYAFNKLDKNEIVYEFEHLNERLNRISAKIRQDRQNTSLFTIAALNSIPLFTVSVWVLFASMLMSS
ncbi:hypothetical protein [Clostridium sp.]|uniref:hypothetical protein n=1 Tax=Clostridium sp. TaxID=1506 RepID=UPI002902E009|nr:hypothetical protein [Clostridium sp.]MDU2155284.1 hypothetical protein [Clostridium sp.]